MAIQPTEKAAPGMPLDPQLWNLTRAAVRAAGEAADNHLEQGGWRPRVALPSVGTFESGWPNPHRSPISAHADDAPTDYSSLFARRRDILKPIAYSDVPEITALFEYVHGNATLAQRVTYSSESGNEELEQHLATFEIADLPLSILDRARAKDLSADEELLGLYLERERAWLLDPLPVDYVVPLALTAIGLGTELTIVDRIRIEPLDSATQAARAPSSYSVAGVPDAVAGAATHAIVISGHQIPNPGPVLRLFGPQEEPLPLDDADLVCQALRIITHLDVGYAQVLRRPLGWTDRWEHDFPTITTVATLRRYPEWFDNFGWLRTPHPIDGAAVRDLPAIFAALQGAPANVRLAARRLSLAATRQPVDEDDRTVDACIGLEALLGEGRDELSHRLAQRAAAVLATRPYEPADPKAVYDLVKKVYAHRSSVVHGNHGERSRRLTHNGRTSVTADVAVYLLREVLADALRRPNGWTPKSLDASLLAALGTRDA